MGGNWNARDFTIELRLEYVMVSMAIQLNDDSSQHYCQLVPTTRLVVTKKTQTSIAGYKTEGHSSVPFCHIINNLSCIKWPQHQDHIKHNLKCSTREELVGRFSGSSLPDKISEWKL